MRARYSFKLVLKVSENEHEHLISDVDVKTEDINQLKAVLKRSAASLNGWVEDQDRR